MTVSATVFEILTLKAGKSLNFSDRPLFEAPVPGNPLEFGDEIWRQKTRVLGLPDGEEIMTLAFFVLTQYRRVTDGQTDGQTDGRRSVKAPSPVPTMYAGLNDYKAVRSKFNPLKSTVTIWIQL